MVRYRLFSHLLPRPPSLLVDLRVRLHVEALDDRITPAAPDVFVDGPWLTREGSSLAIVGSPFGGSGTTWIYLYDSDRATFINNTQFCTVPISVYTVRIEVDQGELSVNSSVPPSTNHLIAWSDGTNAVMIQGDLDDIASYLNQYGLVYTPPTPYFSGTAALTVSVTDPDNLTANAISLIDISPVANPPTVITPGFLSAYSGRPVTLNVQVDLVDQDGSESIAQIGFAGYPTGTVFSAGGEYITDGDSVWYVLPDELAGLTATFPSDVTGCYTIVVFAYSSDQAYLSGSGLTVDNYPAPGVASFDVLVSLPPPDIYLSPDVSTNEYDYANFVYVPSSLDDSVTGLSGDYVYHITATHAVFATFNQGYNYGVYEVGSGTNSLIVTGTLDNIHHFLSSYLYILPAGYFSGEVELAAEVIAPDGRVGSTAVTVRVRPVASTLTPTVIPHIAGVAGETVPLVISIPDTPDPDGSETLTINIQGLPLDAMLSAGNRLDNGTWILSHDDLYGLQLTLPTANLNPFIITVQFEVADLALYPSACEQETSITTSSATIPAWITSVPPLVRPTITGPDSFDIYENGSASFYYTPAPIGGTPFNRTFILSDSDVSPTGIYTVLLQTNVGVIAASPISVGNPGSGVVVSGAYTEIVTLTGTLSDINIWLKRGFSINPPTSFSGEIRVLATTVDPEGLTSQASVYVRVLPTVDYIACFDFPPYIRTRVGYPVNLSFNLPASTDTDGSETRYLKVYGAPSGTIFSAGYQDSEYGYWVIDEADFAGLTITPDDSFSGQIYLSLELVSTDTAFYPSFSWPDDVVKDSTSRFYSTIITVGTWQYPELHVPGRQTGPENGEVASVISFTGATALSVTKSSESNDDYILMLTVPSDYLGSLGTLFVRSGSHSATVVGDGTDVLVVSGSHSAINEFLQLGFDFVPRRYFSGQLTIVAEVVNNLGFTDYGALEVRIAPIASEPVFTLNSGSSGPVLVSPGGYTATPGFVTLTAWPDDFDYSEYGYFGFEISDVPSTSGFSITTGTAGFSFTPGSWITYGTSSAAYLQSLVDSLIIKAPTGFSGTATLTVTFNIYDFVGYTLCEYDSDTRSTSHSVVLRFFAGGISANLPAVNGLEGAATDLGGQYTATDPDAVSGDIHTITFTVPTGTLTVTDSTLPSGTSATGSGTSEVTVQGSLSLINSWLSKAGSLIYTASTPYFSGMVSLTARLQNDTLPNTATTVVSGGLLIAPVASVLTPIVTSPVTTAEEMPVSIPVELPYNGDSDGSETVTIVFSGVPQGAAFSAGSSTGSGTWQVDSTQLKGLTFTPPLLYTGTINMTLRAVVNDDAGFTANQSQSAEVPLQIDVIGTLFSFNYVDGFVAENSPPGTYVGQLSATGGHPGETFTYKVVGSSGYNFTIHPIDGTIRVGSQNPDYEELRFFDLSIRVTGSRGTIVDLSVPVTLLNMNDPPRISGPAAFTGREDNTITLIGIVVSDQDADRQPSRDLISATIPSFTAPAIVPPAILHVEASVPFGTLMTRPGSGVTISEHGTSVSLMGSLADLNALFAAGGLQYLGTPDFSGSVLLSLSIDDFGQTGPGGPQTGRASIPINVEPVADPPKLEVFNAAGVQNRPISLGILAGSTDRDGSEQVEAIIFSGMPSGSFLNHGGALADGRWLIRPIDLLDLTITTPPDFVGTFSLTVIVIMIDHAPSLQMTSTSEASATLIVEVSAALVAPPEKPVVQETTSTSIVLFLPLTTTTSTRASETSEWKPVAEPQQNSQSSSTEQTSENESESSSLNYIATVSIPDFRGGSEDARHADVVDSGPNYNPTQQAPTFYGFSSVGGKPPPTVVPLDPTSTAGGFGGAEGENIGLIDELYRDQGPSPTPTIVPTEGAMSDGPVSDGGPDSAGEDFETVEDRPESAGAGTVGIFAAVVAAASLAAIGVLNSPAEPRVRRYRRMPLRPHTEEETP